MLDLSKFDGFERALATNSAVCGGALGRLRANAPALLAELREARKAMRAVVADYERASKEKYTEWEEFKGVKALRDALARVKDGEA